MVHDFFQVHLPTKLIAGAGLAGDFSTELADLGIQRPLIVCDPVVRRLGLVDGVVAGLENAGLTIGAIYDQVPPNSEMGVVRQVADAFRSADCDGFIAIGGGSTIDTAKVANVMVTEDADITEFVGVQLLTRPLKPLVCLPTTSGTGSEVTQVAVVLDEADKTKVSFADRFLAPHLAVLDPELTVSMPPQVTAATGMDALTHAMEAFIGPQASPVSDAIAFGTLQLIHRSLLAAVRTPDDLAARSDMQVAACMGGIALTHSMVGTVHAMSHTVGGLFHVPHGTANSILLPCGLRHNLDVAAAKIARMAPAFDLVPATSDRETAERVIAYVEGLKDDLHALCGLPRRLREVGIGEGDLPAIAAGSLMDGASFYSPHEMDEASVLAALQSAY